MYCCVKGSVLGKTRLRFNLAAVYKVGGEENIKTPEEVEESIGQNAGRGENLQSSKEGARP